LGTRTIVAFLSAALLFDLPARADDAPDVENADRTPAEVDAFLADYAPPPVEGPELRLPYTPTRLYLDAGYGRTNDISSLPVVQGSARNFRFAAGGSWRWRRFAFTGELPFLQVTTVDFTELNNQLPSQWADPGDAHQTAASLGDLRLGADWTDHLSDAILGGFGFRVRGPTHTTRFAFHLADGEDHYVLPYYFHLEPTAILGAAVGPFTFVVNQGALVLLGPDGDFEGFHITVPTIAFWDAAYAVSWAPLATLAASLELATDIQINHIAGLDFTSFNDLRAISLVPAVQWHVVGLRVDLIARFGVSKGATPVGILEYAGTTSYTLRVTRPF
jgi:hypothetical protein